MNWSLFLFYTYYINNYNSCHRNSIRFQIKVKINMDRRRSSGTRQRPSTSGSRGGGPNGRGPMIFLMPKTRFFSIFLRSRLILSIILIEIKPKHATNEFYFNLQHFSMLTQNYYLNISLMDECTTYLSFIL